MAPEWKGVRSDLEFVKKFRDRTFEAKKITTKNTSFATLTTKVHKCFNLYRKGLAPFTYTVKL